MTRKWTFMVYMAGDNGRIFDDGGQLMVDLQKFGWSDIAEMVCVGSTDDVAIVAQYDTLTQQQFTPRFYLDSSSETGRLVEKVPPVNTGDPHNLTDFIVWATKSYPAERYALVLWNHGSGWKEDDIYARYRDLGHIQRRDQVRSIQPGKRLLRHALFLPTATEIMSIEDDEVRGICYDDSSMDFLDSHDLKKALVDAAQQTGQRLSVLGMDACLMSMAEVAYQVRGCADFMVSSQEVEPGDGWPYKDILSVLVAHPELSARELSKIIVDKFGTHYLGQGRSGGGTTTQSAIDLQAMPMTYEKVTALSEAINTLYSTDFKTELAVGRAKNRTLTFSDEDYIDLAHFAQLLANEYTGTANLRALAVDLVTHLMADTPGSPVIANYHGQGRPNANGLSIYFPARRYSPFYDRQDFTLSGWGNVVRRVNQIPEPVIAGIDDEANNALQKGGLTDPLSIRCPICGAQMKLPSNLEGISLTIATKSIRDALTEMMDLLRRALASPTAESNVWIDLPCPNCRHTFQYNLHTGESRR